MAARSLWKGAITFSLVHVPVALHSAVRTSTLDLDLLDKRDFAPVGYQKINKVTGRPVEGDDIVKGYEHRPGEYVVLTDEWKPDQYRDTYRQDILARVEQKVERGLTHELTEPEGKEPEAEATPALADLSALLERSLAVAGELQGPGRKKRPARGGSRRASSSRS
jgi:non-homologous end joining protein Ku